MPKLVVTIYLCSVCKDEFREDAITSLRIARQSGPELLLDLCAECMSTSEQSLASFLDLAYSEGPRSAKTASGESDGPYSCPECASVYTSFQGLAQHRSRKHGVTSATGARMAARGLVGDHVCEDCGFRSTRAQGLAAHRRVAHVVAMPAAKRKPSRPGKAG